MPHFDTVRSRQELVTSCFIEKDACLEGDKTLAATSGGDINEKDALISSPSWEEIVVLLKKVPCFIAPESLTPGVDVLFSLTRGHFVNLPSDASISGVVRLLQGTSKSVIRCTHLMLKYTTEEMAEVVRFAPFLPKFT